MSYYTCQSWNNSISMATTLLLIMQLNKRTSLTQKSISTYQEMWFWKRWPGPSPPIPVAQHNDIYEENDSNVVDSQPHLLRTLQWVHPWNACRPPHWWGIQLKMTLSLQSLTRNKARNGQARLIGASGNIRGRKGRLRWPGFRVIGKLPE